jgi:hypothetical protein
LIDESSGGTASRAREPFVSRWGFRNGSTDSTIIQDAVTDVSGDSSSANSLAGALGSSRLLDETVSQGRCISNDGKLVQ